MISKIKSWFKREPLHVSEVPVLPALSRRLPRFDPKDDRSEGLDLEVLAAEMEKVRQKENRAMKILDILEIPHTLNFVQATTLVDILMDPEKFKKLTSKLRLKAFW